MTPNEILANLHPYLQAPENQVIDLTQHLENGSTIISEAVKNTNDDGTGIWNLLSVISQQITAGKTIILNFDQPTNAGASSLYKDIIAKSIYSMQLNMIMDSLVSIHNNSENKIDWNAPVFHEGNHLLLECARLGLDNIVQTFVTLKDLSSVPLFKVNQQNDGGLRVIDYYKERIDNREGAVPVIDDPAGVAIVPAAILPVPAPNAVGIVQDAVVLGNAPQAQLVPPLDNNPALAIIVPPIAPPPPLVMMAGGAIVPAAPFFPLDLMMQIVGTLRKAGSLEPQKEFIPSTGKLDTENVHSASNEPIIAAIIERLNSTYRDVDVEKEIAELYYYIGKKFTDSTDTVIQEIKTKALSNLDNLQSIHQVDEHHTVWVFKNEIAHLWLEAQATSNESGFVYTLSDLIGCYWGQLVNLCRTAEGADYIDFKAVHSKGNEIVIKRVMNQLEGEFGDAVFDQVLFDLSEYINANKPELRENLIRLLHENTLTEHNITWKFSEQLVRIWSKAKFAGNQDAVLESIETVHEDPWSQLLKICHVVELRPKNAFVIDFDALQQDEAKLNEISNIVLNKLKMQIPDMRALSKIIVKWQEEQIKSANHLAFKDFTPENELVGGIFNDIFLEMVQKAGKHVALAYSVDFKKFANIVNYIASNIEYYDEGAGNDLYDFLLHAQYIDHVEFVTICNVNNFATELEVFRQAHDGCKFNLNVKAMNGRPLICELMDRISGCTPQQIKEVLDVVMNKDVVEVNWTASDNVVLYHYPVPVGVQIATIEPVKYHHSAIEKLYNTFAHTANSEAIITFMISILSDPAVYASQAAHDFIQHISTPGYGPMNMVHAEIFKAIVESKGTIDIAKVKDAELFITFFQMPDFAERLDTFVQKHGSLDMSMKTLSGKPMLLHMIETVGVHFETALTLMNNPNITNVDWCATDAEGHSVIEKLYQKSANMPMPADGMNNNACEIIVLLLSNPEFNRDGLNELFWNTVCNISPEHFVTFQDIVATGLDGLAPEFD